MKVLLAPDSFKGALTAASAAAAMARGLRKVWPDAQCVLLPVGDGGEGTLDTLVAATGGELVRESVCGPMGTPVLAHWGILGDGKTAVIELAQAAGLPLVPQKDRDPKLASTFGVGELIRSAASRAGVRKLLIALGGSATNDGGAGILQALGVELLDSRGVPIGRGGQALIHLARVNRSGLLIDASVRAIQIACDVDIPLTGPRGASTVFGPQKGATREDVAILDRALAHYATVLEIDTTVPGSGAAGGATAGLRWLFPQAELYPGIELVLDAIDFDEHLKGADLVLTGEGRMDIQTLSGKAIAGVGRRARAADVPVGAIVGSLDGGLDLDRLARETGVAAVLPLAPGPCSLEDSICNTEIWLERAAERAARWMAL